ncbi:dihydroorotate dehydrogenase (NAD+) catalytic subunit [Marinitoga hydrogenitolerans DSM 16785]|uniref:Dihydroorotate dehydrogenase n=1 Tax=Marinitoga hydrogenitolerans (strain DSM 16785 / JCM 12826 / AT1271) TaxID=1122195 RepID=A0A1M4VIM6_MARH1|nr:dihydroorotate dehydrogenase [Marinitoga hydrogenitolerans]SHE68881.1 dihydroorotate dehydrogenase (NAD+) catalytic subunit [Marinitoga hydrogenitolerans DSM 16785]
MVEVCGVKFKNPIIIASGPGGNGKELAKYIDLNKLGGFTAKTVTPDEKEGNPPPRIVNVKSGIINSIGLQNPGIEKFIKNDLPFLENLDTNVILSIGGDKKSDYIKLIESLNNSSAAFFELNLSCPNVGKNGIPLGIDEIAILDLVKEAKKISKKPIFIKLGVETFLEDLVEAAVKGGADGVTLINSPKGLKIDINKKKPILKKGVGGFSGPAIKPIALATIFRIRKKFKKLTIIGMGGVFSYEDAIEFIMAGANLVGVGSGVMADPEIPIKIIDDLDKYFKRVNYEDILSCAVEGFYV